MSESHPPANYIGHLLYLIALATVLFVPQLSFSQSNWQFNYTLVLIVAWALIIRFIWVITHSYHHKYEKNLFRVYLGISSLVVAFLCVGTFRLLTSDNLLTMNGTCTLGALRTPRTSQYFLYVSAGKKHKRFSISEEKFASLLQKNHYTIRSNDEVLYPCQNDEITVQFIPHFEFLVE